MSLEQYMKDISRYPLLSPDEEKMYAGLAIKGDQAARQTLINSNLRLVIFIARIWSWADTIDDLVQEGNKGLVRAVDRYLPEKDVRFSTFAYSYIKGYILEYINNLGQIRLPKHVSTTHRRINAVRDDLTSEGRIFPTSREIAVRLSVLDGKERHPEYVSSMLKLAYQTNTISLNTPIQHDQETGKHTELLDAQVDPHPGILDALDRHELTNIILEHIMRLPPDEESLVHMIFYQQLSHEEIVDIFKLGRERVKQIYFKALRRLSISILDEPRLRHYIDAT
ncbi:sigma-70 family RNA polymerase sigma factor [Candidatus Woesearchaeota archaeon]|nr:sigma-70 family RNA polymerase sigma factor [Candidatus Woesearchaeota archaeon]